MAFTVPERLGAGGLAVTPGERKVFSSLRDHLPEDYLVYYDLRVGGRYPDFIVIGPDLGLVVLEVKDWRRPAIAAVTRDRVTIRRPDGDHVLNHPLQQARDYVHRIVDVLRQRPALRSGEHLACGWGYGAVLPSLETTEIQAPSLLGPTLEEALGPGLVLTADDLTEERLLPRLRALIPAGARRGPALTPAQVDEIRAALHPEIRIGWACSDADVVRVMDREQERLAKSLGDGHRLLRGVAGSGKTITLMCRARHLHDRHPDWRLLILTFNRVLADSLRQAIGADEMLEVLTFHAWCERQLRRAGVTMPPRPPRGTAWDQYWQAVPGLLLDAYAQGRAPEARYQAILIDEGQDFVDDWYRVVLSSLDPGTNSLFIALDSSQNIYRRTVSWRDLGIQLAGRSRVLRVNYRNTRPILATAYAVIESIDSSAGAGRAPEDEYVVPDRVLRNGPPPEIHRQADQEGSQAFALEWVRTRLARGIPPDDLLLLSPHRLEIEALTAWLAKAGVPAAPIATPTPIASVRLSTIHSAKGLDAAHVLVLGGHLLEQRDDEEGRRLLYIAMTRARDALCVCYHGESRLMAELEAALAGPRSRPS